MKIQLKSILFAASVIVFASCNQETKKEAVETAEVIEKTEMYQSYGASITDENATSVIETEALLMSSDSVEIKLTGEISKTCVNKGCWMTVDTGNGESMRVTFKDYGFFVPKEGMEGKTVVFEGKAFKTTTSVEELQHYAKDGGASEEEIAKITEPKNEISFVAEGVLIKS